MADAFEYKYFGNLTKNGTTDTDGDGVSDKQEYLEGTNPTLVGDRLRITVAHLDEHHIAPLPNREHDRSRHSCYSRCLDQRRPRSDLRRSYIGAADHTRHGNEHNTLWHKFTELPQTLFPRQIDSPAYAIKDRHRSRPRGVIERVDI